MGRFNFLFSMFCVLLKKGGDHFFYMGVDVFAFVWSNASVCVFKTAFFGE